MSRRSSCASCRALVAASLIRSKVLRPGSLPYAVMPTPAIQLIGCVLSRVGREPTGPPGQAICDPSFLAAAWTGNLLGLFAKNRRQLFEARRNALAQCSDA